MYRALEVLDEIAGADFKEGVGTHLKR